MEKENAKYLASLRRAMKDRAIDAVVITSTDPHQSENAPAHWRGREWLTGFASVNGTNGTAVVTADEALCWTDSRYFLQAEEQLQGTGFKMMPEDGPEAVDLVDWLVEHTNSGQTVGIDGMTFSIAFAQRIEQALGDNGVKLDTDFPLFDLIWGDRPARPANKLFVHDEEVVGEDVNSKMTRLLKEVKGELANAILLSALDDIAWATNVRTTGDIAFSPMFVSFLYIDDEKRILFVDEEKITPEVEAHFKKYGIETRPYDAVKEFLKDLPHVTRLLLDPQKTARGIYDAVGCTPVFGGDAVSKLKSIKNSTMLANIATAMEKDGVALVKFFMYMEKEFPKGDLTEVGLEKVLTSLRRADASCVDNSFAPIIGWQGHGAIVHYEATEESDVTLAGHGLLLVDSGGQYIYGTTDITRTVSLGGDPTPQERHDFTLVMKGHIALASVHFPQGTTGHQLDVLARQFLWKEGKAYFHGTGHGVGFFINCHEGPQSIRLNQNPTPLEPGMVMSNEPGLYLTDKYGIRCENLITPVVAADTDFGRFYRFETLTLFPFDRSLFDTSIMSDEEIEWVNKYHDNVRARLTPLLNKEEQEWLKAKTEPLK